MLKKVWKATERSIHPEQLYKNTSINFKTCTQFICNEAQRLKRIKDYLLGKLSVILFITATCGASAETGSFTVHFAGCTEFAGWGPVSLAEAQPLVPAGYVMPEPQSDRPHSWSAQRAV